MEANNKLKEDLLDHLDGFNEDISLIEIVKNDLKYDEESNVELVRYGCEMMEDDDPAIKSMTFEKIAENIFEITEIRRDGR